MKLRLKNWLCFYTPTVNNGKGNKKEIPFMTASKRIKCLGINWTKEVFNSAVQQKLQNIAGEIKEGLSEWKDISCSWVGRQYCEQWILLRAMYTFNTILIKILTSFFAEMEKSILKFIWNCKGLQKAKTILKKEEKRTDTSRIQTYLKAILIKTDRYINQWNRIGSPEINPYIHLRPNDFWQVCKVHGMEKEQSLEENGAATTGLPHVKE